MQYKQTLRWLTITVLALTTLVGCGDSPELKLQQAKIALANSKPDRALQLVGSVLKEQPENLEAMWVKARSEMLLAKLSSAKTTLDGMLKEHPDDPKVRRAMVDWSWLRLRNLLTQSDFATDEKILERFEDALATGMDQAQWLEDAGELADSGYFRARYFQLDSIRYRQLLDAKERSLTGMTLDVDEQIQEENDFERKQLERKMNDRLEEAEDQLKTVIEKDPNHFKACEMYVTLLVQNSHWVDMWELAERYPAADPIPDTTAEQIITALVRMPDSIQPLDQRVDRGWKVLNAVRDTDKESATWQITASRLHIVSAEFKEALPLLESALKKRPGDLDAQYFLAQAHFNMDHFDQAMEIIEVLRKRASRSSRVQTLYGLTLMKQGNLIMAKEALRLATDLNPRDAMAREGFLALMAQEGHISQARGDVDAYYSLNPSDPRAIRFKMQFEIANARQDEVAKLMKNVEQLVPLTDSHLEILVDGNITLQKFDVAEHFAKILVRNKPQALRAHLKLAESVLMQGKDNQVKEQLTALRQQFPEAASVSQMLGKLYLQRQSYDKAAELLESVVRSEPDNHTARILLAQGYASLVLTDEALEQLDYVLEEDPDDMRAHALAARIYQFTGRVEKANEHLDQIDEEKIDERTNPTLLAQLMLKRDKVDEALAICNRAVASGNSDPVLRLLLAAIYRAKDNPEQIEINLLALVNQQPRNPQAFALLTQFYKQQNEVKRGLIVFQDLQQLNEPLARLAQATLLSGIGQYEAAILKLEPIYEPLVRKRDQAAMVIAKALVSLHEKLANLKLAAAVFDVMIDAEFMAGEARIRQIELIASTTEPEKLVEMLDQVTATLSPDDRRLGYRIMQQYARFGRPDKALELAEDWISQRPDQAMLHRWRGELLLQLRRAPDAILAYETAVKLDPESIGMRLRLGKAHIRNFDYPAAEQVFREAASVDGGSRITALAALGDMLVQLGLYDQAAKTFEELDELGKARDPRVLFTMGRALVALGRDSEAAQRLEEIPKYATQYAVAQIMLARIDQRLGNTEDAQERLLTLAKSSRYAPVAIRELFNSRWRNPSDEDLLRWSDRAVNLKSLQPQLRYQWLGIRLRLAANDHDWAAALETMERMMDIQPDVLPLAAGRILMLRQLTRIDTARDLYRATPALSRSPAGPLIAAALELEASPIEGAPLPRYLQAMAQGDVEAARAAAEALPAYKTIFRSDLIAVTERPDAKSPEMEAACVELGVALTAMEFCGLPQLTEVICNRIAKQIPSLTPAHSFASDARIRQGKDTRDALELVQEVLPTSTLAMYLKSRAAAADGDFDTAADLARQALEREPSNQHLRYSLSQVLQQGDRFAAAIEVHEQIRADETDIYRTLASNDMAYLLAEHFPARLAEAKEIATAAVKAAPNQTAILDTLAWIEYLQGDKEVALTRLNQAIIGLREIPEAHYHLAVVYRALGNEDWASYHARQAATAPLTNPIKKKATSFIEESPS